MIPEVATQRRWSLQWLKLYRVCYLIAAAANFAYSWQRLSTAWSHPIPDIVIFLIIFELIVFIYEIKLFFHGICQMDRLEHDAAENCLFIYDVFQNIPDDRRDIKSPRTLFRKKDRSIILKVLISKGFLLFTIVKASVSFVTTGFDVRLIPEVLIIFYQISIYKLCVDILSQVTIHLRYSVMVFYSELNPEHVQQRSYSQKKTALAAFEGSIFKVILVLISFLR